ncbi:hypothetical protein M407DRAFT_176738 [Tulasnella calospora MUT 4182]|uniref:Uncharacterized protein n=1 Tax=Tulasnella calospora MUT 4182 TaxID=1051891 RepID=A0A0C3QNR5_9AGAM|nr:hypothetical protein M407DRAFT_176738 [Tulasnella calospora MUT 4182]
MDFPFPYNWLGSLRNSSHPLSPTFSGFSNLAPLSRPDSHPIGTNVTPPYGQLEAAIWNYNPIDDSIQALLQDGGCTYLMAIAVNVDNGRLLLATNFSAFRKAYPQKNYALVRLILEQV